MSKLTGESADIIRQSRRKNLTRWDRIILRFLPVDVLLQVIREYELADRNVYQYDGSDWVRLHEEKERQP